jgi:hypothetical protein
MGLFRAPDPLEQQRSKPTRLRLLSFLVLIYLGSRFLHRPLTPNHASFTPAQAPILIESSAGEKPDEKIYHLAGNRIRGNGTSIDLGDRQTNLPGSLYARFFPHELILPSCLTQPPPPPARQPAEPLPVRDDWPGFYGAPWLTQLNGNLIVLLHVYAPRRSALPVPAPEFQIYPDQTNAPTTPSFSSSAPATFTRGSKAVLYRVFVSGPVRCLDLVVQNGENNGIGHLYYRIYHHYYETNAIFHILP